jgi:predicted permease
MLRNFFLTGWRNLRHNKAYALINVTGLAMGITCSLLIFMFVSYHYSFDGFHRNKDRIYRVFTEFNDEAVTYSTGVPGPLGKAFRTDFTYAEKTARIVSYSNVIMSLPQEKDVPKFKEEPGIAFTEPFFFDIFDFPLVLGNKKTVLAAPNEAIVTERIAGKYFGSSQNAIGKIISFDNKINFTITGILKNLPSNSDIQTEIFVSYDNLRQQNQFTASDSSWGGVYGSSKCYLLLRPAVTLNQVTQALDLTVKKYYKGKDLNVWKFRILPMSEVHFSSIFEGSIDRKYLWALVCIGFFLIITACLNFINLATAQALHRSKEIGIRKVMGSLGKQLFWQFMAETGMVTLMATVLACCLTLIALPYLNQLLGVNISLQLLGNAKLLLFLSLLCIAIIFLAGSYPSLVMARFQPAVSLKGKLTEKHIGGFSLRRVLVVTQFAISQMLIIGAIIIAGQLRYSTTSDLGFNKETIVMLSVPVQDKAKLSTLQKGLTAIAGVEKVSYCLHAPATQSGNTTGLRFDNRPEDEHWSVNTLDVDNEYLSTFGLKLVAGRNFFVSDTAKEFVVNETFLRKMNVSNPQDVIGKTLSLSGGKKKGPIVGVVKDFYTNSFHTEIAPICLMPNYYQYINCAVKIKGGSLKQTLAATEKKWNEVFPEFVYNYEFLDDRIAKFYKQDTVILKLVEVFSFMAILIGCLGLYGLVSFMAARRTKEIGIRKLMGASLEQILWLFGKEFCLLLLIAFAVAAPLAWLIMSRYLNDFKYRIQIGPGVFVMAILCTFVLAILTVGYRAIRSALENPARSLRVQ